MARLLVGAYALLVAGLLAGALAIRGLHCEGFGCMGIGVAWFAWVVGYAVVLGVGLLARARAGATGLGWFCRAAWWLQLATGAVLLALWAFRH